MRKFRPAVGLALAVVALSSASCDSKKSAPSGANPTPAPAAKPALPPAAPDQPADQPAQVAPATLDQSATIPGLQLALKIPGCATLITSPGYREGAPPTAQVQPKDPECRVFGIPGVVIREANSDYGNRDQAEAFVAKTFRGEHITITDSADGYRVAYDKVNAFRKSKEFGVILARKIGARVIHCRGEGTADELKNIEAVCASLTLAP